MDTFKHSLTQEVAYATLLPDDRRELHAKVARLAQRPEVIARHLTAAELTDEAIPHWLEAGRRAIRSSASEAVSHLTTAIELLLRKAATPERDRTELELQLALGPALIMTRGYAAPDVAAAYLRARTLCEQFGDSPELFLALDGIWTFHVIRRELRVARSIVYGQDPLVVALSYLGWAFMLQERENEALASLERALHHADVIGHAFSRAVALYFSAVVNDHRGDFARALGHAEHLIALADEHRLPFWRIGGVGLRGRALAAQGRHAEGIELMNAALKSSRAASAGIAVTYYLRSIADAHREVGAREQALAAIAEALAAAGCDEDRSGEPELYRIRGEILAADPGSSLVAEESLRNAVTLAREQGLVLFVRRAAASYAAFLCARGRASEAEQLLTETTHVH